MDIFKAKWPKMAKSGPKWPKMGIFKAKMAKNGPK